MYRCLGASGKNGSVTSCRRAGTPPNAKRCGHISSVPIISLPKRITAAAGVLAMYASEPDNVTETILWIIRWNLSARYVTSPGHARGVGWDVWGGAGWFGSCWSAWLTCSWSPHHHTANTCLPSGLPVFNPDFSTDSSPGCSAVGLAPSWCAYELKSIMDKCQLFWFGAPSDEMQQSQVVKFMQQDFYITIYNIIACGFDFFDFFLFLHIAF